MFSLSLSKQSSSKPTKQQQKTPKRLKVPNKTEKICTQETQSSLYFWPVTLEPGPCPGVWLIYAVQCLSIGGNRFSLSQWVSITKSFLVRVVLCVSFPFSVLPFCLAWSCDDLVDAGSLWVCMHTNPVVCSELVDLESFTVSGCLLLLHVLKDYSAYKFFFFK